MNKTLYIRDDDLPVWDRARELAGEKLSPVIVDALKKFVAEKEATQKGYERIEVEYNDALDHHLPKIKAFYGRWIIPRNKPLQWIAHEEQGERHTYSVAITPKGSWVVYFREETPHDDGGYSTLEKLLVYPSVVKAAADNQVNFAIREAVKAMGVPVEELDI